MRNKKAPKKSKAPKKERAAKQGKRELKRKTRVYSGWEPCKMGVQRYNFVNSDGEMLSKVDFDRVYDFRHGYALVRFNNKFNHINTEGKFLSEQWWDWARDWWGTFAFVKLNEKWNCVGKDGKVIFNQWFDLIDQFTFNFCRVTFNGWWNWIGFNGKLLSEEWFGWAGNFDKNGVAECGYDGEEYIIDCKGVVYKKQTNAIEKKRPSENTFKLRNSLYTVFVDPNEISYALISDYRLKDCIYLCTGYDRHEKMIATVYYASGAKNQIIAETEVKNIREAADELNKKIDKYLTELDKLYDFDTETNIVESKKQVQPKVYDSDDDLPF